MPNMQLEWWLIHSPTQGKVPGSLYERDAMKRNKERKTLSSIMQLFLDGAIQNGTPSTELPTLHTQGLTHLVEV